MLNQSYTRWIAGAALTLALAGTALFAGNAAAQTPPATEAPAPSTTAVPAAPDGAGVKPPGRDGFGGPGGRGHGGFGGPGGAATADGAANAISQTTQALTLAQGDLTYATGKMDTAGAQRWLNAADGLIAKAQDAQTNQQYGQAVAYAQAARELAQTAEQAMAQALGADTLPSYSQRAQRGGPRGGLDPAQAQTPTQAQVSRELQNLYNRIVSQGALVGANAEAAGYLTEAQAQYKTAYDAYQAANYDGAHDAARLAEHLLKVTASLVGVASAPANADTPATVPAPNF